MESLGGEGKNERVLRWLRNINALGAVAIGGVGLVIQSELLLAWGTLNAAQALFFEVARQVVKRRKSPKLLAA